MSHERRFAHSNNPGFACHPDVLILPFGRRSFLPAIAARLGAEPVPLDENTDREIFNPPRGGLRVTLMYSGMGGPAIVNALEMARANGAARVAIFGACGGMDPRLKVGHLLVPPAAVRDEGASRAYAPLEFPAVFDPELAHRLLVAAQAGVVPVHTGVVYTTDTSYRVGPDVYERYRGLVLGADCECASAAVAGARLGLAVAALLFCTDNVTLPGSGDRRYRGLAKPAVRRGFNAGIEAVIRVLTGPA
ncbi:MAG TPA: hypothetical protein PKM55_16960 [Acidobacteriota bacterium]|nr:hypothetical protein [Acidobacteriota bacterium]